MENVNKSGEMFKAFVAKIAEQATEIFLQARDEKREIIDRSFEINQELREEIAGHDHNLHKIEDYVNSLKEDHAETVKGLEAEVERYKKYWHDTLNNNRELVKERNDLLAKLSLDETVDGLMGPIEGGKE